MDQPAEKDKIEKVKGLGRRTREEIVKWNQMTALGFQTGGSGRHQTLPVSLRETKTHSNNNSNNGNLENCKTQILVHHISVH